MLWLCSFPEIYNQRKTKYTRQTPPNVVAIIIAQLLGKVKLETRNRPLKGGEIIMYGLTSSTNSQGVVFYTLYSL